MRKTQVFWLSVGMCLLFLPSALAQADIIWKHMLSSKYVSRGINTVNNWVYQPSISIQQGNFTALVWGNMELTNHNGSIYNRSKPAGTFTEWDFTIEYATRWKNLNIALGWVDYQYPGTGWERTQEAYLSLSVDSPLPTNLTTYRDVGVAKGTYITASVELPVAPRLQMSALAGYACAKFNGYRYGREVSSWVDLTLGLSTTIDVSNGWQVKPTLWFSTLLDKRLLAGQPNRQNVWFSVELYRER